MKSHSIEKFLDFLIPLGTIKSQWRQIKLVPKLYGVEVDAFYWTDMAPDIVNPGREEQGSFSV